MVSRVAVEGPAPMATPGNDAPVGVQVPVSQQRTLCGAYARRGRHVRYLSPIPRRGIVYFSGGEVRVGVVGAIVGVLDSTRHQHSAVSE